MNDVQQKKEGNNDVIKIDDKKNTRMNEINIKWKRRGCE